MDSLRIFVSRICRKKALTSDPFSGSHLKGYVNAVDLTVSGVASTLGAGIYVVIGEVVRDSAGPAVVLSFLIAAISSILSGLCFAELVAHVPKNRSVYLGTYAVVGELMAFIAAWNLIFQYTLDTACLAKTWSLNLDGLTGNAISAFLVENLPLNATGLSAHVDPLAFGTTIIVTALLGFCGCELALMNHIFTFVNLVVIFYVSVVGLFASNRKNWSLDPLQALEKGFIQNVGNGGFAPFGVSGILASAATCFYCFIGFHAVSSTGKDVRNPQRSITIATIFCILICFSCYSMVSIVLTLLVPYYSVSRTTPLPEAFARVGWPVAGHIVTVGGLCALSARLLGGLFPLPRVFNRLSSDGLVFRCVGGLNSCTKTRLVAMLLSGVAAGIMAALFNLQDLVDMATIGALLTFALIALFALILRYRHHSEPLHQRTTTSFATKRENVEESSTSTEQQTPISPSAEQHKKLSSSIGLIGYLELSFCPRHSLVGRTPDSRWIGLTNSLLLFFSVIGMNLGLVGSDYASSTLLDVLHAVTIIFGLFAILLCISLAKQPTSADESSFKVPGSPWIPAISMTLTLHLMFRMTWIVWIVYAHWVVLGLVIYFSYGYWHSMERKKSENITDCWHEKIGIETYCTLGAWVIVKNSGDDDDAEFILLSHIGLLTVAFSLKNPLAQNIEIFTSFL